MYMVTVTFDVDPARLDDFMPAVRANAKTSVAVEPGCRRFDVCQDAERPTRVFLYELYDDRAAFDAHLASARFKAFDGAVADMLCGKAVETWRLDTSSA